jgi:hypothetical protein
MRPTRSFWQACVLILGASAFALGADPVPEPKIPPLTLSEDDFKQLTARAEAVVREVLAKDKPDKKEAARAQAAVLVLAIAGQDAPTPAGVRQRLLARDTALALNAALDKRDFAGARRIVEELAKPPADAKPAAGPVQILDKAVAFGDLMHQFNELGGSAKKLPTLVGGKKSGKIPAAALTPELQLLGWQAAAVGQLSAGHNDPKTTAKDPKAWRTYADELKQSGLDLAEAVKAKDGAAAWAAANRMQNSCTDCHTKFK